MFLSVGFSVLWHKSLLIRLLGLESCVLGDVLGGMCLCGAEWVCIVACCEAVYLCGCTDVGYVCQCVGLCLVVGWSLSSCVWFPVWGGRGAVG